MGLSLKKKDVKEEPVLDAPGTTGPHAVDGDPANSATKPTAPKRVTGPAFYWSEDIVVTVLEYIVNTSPVPSSEDVLAMLQHKLKDLPGIDNLTLNKVRMKLSLLRKKYENIPVLARGKPGKQGYSRERIEAILAGRK